MKKILITTLLTVSTVAFAKTEEPKTKTDLPKKEEKVLVAKKPLKEMKYQIIIGHSKICSSILAKLLTG